MNWTIFFAVLILVCLFARPAWWVFKTAMSVLGCITGSVRGLVMLEEKRN